MKNGYTEKVVYFLYILLAILQKYYILQKEKNCLWQMQCAVVHLIFLSKYLFKRFCLAQTFPLSCIEKMTEGRHSRFLVNLDVKVSLGKSSGQRSQVNFWHVLTVLWASRVNFQEGPFVDFTIFLLPEHEIKHTWKFRKTREITEEYLLQAFLQRNCTFFSKTFL